MVLYMYVTSLGTRCCNLLLVMGVTPSKYRLSCYFGFALIQ
jgi:hypothetical protein